MTTTWLKIGDNIDGLLQEPVLGADTSLILVDASKFPATGDYVVTIESEKILCSGKTSNTLNVTTRGYESTAPSDHASNTKVELRIIAKHISDITTAVTALEGSSLTVILQAVYPVGSIYISVTSTNPATVFGFGTWAAFGEGKTLVGFHADETEFDTVEETGGFKTHTLSEAELAAHHHTVDPPATASGGISANHTHPYTSSARPGAAAVPSGSYYAHFEPVAASTGTVSSDHTHTTDIAVFDSGDIGSGTAHNNLQPYITTYFFKRTA
jgi:microcystin-dependent protein